MKKRPINVVKLPPHPAGLKTKNSPPRPKWRQGPGASGGLAPGPGFDFVAPIGVHMNLEKIPGDIIGGVSKDYVRFSCQISNQMSNQSLISVLIRFPNK